MTNFYVTYVCENKAVRDEFYSKIREGKIDELSRGENGCEKYEYFYPAESDNILFLWEQWESREAQKIHMQQPHYLKLAAIKEALGIETQVLIEERA